MCVRDTRGKGGRLLWSLGVFCRPLHREGESVPLI